MLKVRQSEASSEALLFSGSSHPLLAQEIADNLGIELGKVNICRFPDQEISIQIMENVRGRHAFVVQSVALDPNNYLIELLILVDALKRASAASITAVIPYFGYCRQDRKDKERVPITAKLVANLLTNAGVTHVLTMDLHAGQMQGFFDIPVDNLHAMPHLAHAFKDLISEAMLSSGQNGRTGQPGQPGPELDLNKFVVVAPDIGSIKLTHVYANWLGVDFSVVDKHRVSATKVEVATVIGEVKGKNVLLADDMCSTAGTLVSAAKACREKGAERVFAAITHGIFVGDSVEKIERSPIEALFMSNTIPYTERLAKSSKIRTVSVADLFARAIHCIISQESISSLEKSILGAEGVPLHSHKR